MRSREWFLLEACVFVLLVALLLVPALTYASDGIDLSAPQTTVAAAADAPSADSAVSTESVDVAQGEPTDVAADPTPAAEPADAVSVDAPDTAAPDQDDSASDSATATQMSSQANPDTQEAVEAVLKSRKLQYDATVSKLQRSIAQLTAIIRRLDAAGVNTFAARVRLSDARLALSRAKAAERITVARYRSVIGAENESDAFSSARAAARASSAALERARVKVLTATRTLRAIVKNVTVQNAGASTDNT